MPRIVIVSLLLILVWSYSANGAKNAAGIDDEMTRNRDHISKILRLNSSEDGYNNERQKLLARLNIIHKTSILPVEQAYKYNSLGVGSVTGAEINAKPILLFIGPWSTGKTTMINYILGIDKTPHALHTAAEPTTSEFTAIMYGADHRPVEGNVLTTDPNHEFADLEKFGQSFLERFEGVTMPSPLLQRLTIIDTPGIIENRRQQERGYPFNDVMKWFIDRAALILVTFDPSKLDVGKELESTFNQLKGRESQVRFVLNKADTIELQELMRVYGAFFWNLSPLINVTEPPRIYVGSFWSAKLRGQPSNHALFHNQEVALLNHLYDVIAYSLLNKIALVRQHAIHVMQHAEMVSAYLNAFSKEKSMVWENDGLWNKIITFPDRYGIERNAMASLSSLPFVSSQNDLQSAERYASFLRAFDRESFKRLSDHCSYFSGCLGEGLVEAIAVTLPQLLTEAQQLTAEKNEKCSSKSKSCS